MLIQRCDTVISSGELSLVCDVTYLYCNHMQRCDIEFLRGCNWPIIILLRLRIHRLISYRVQKIYEITEMMYNLTHALFERNLSYSEYCGGNVQLLKKFYNILKLNMVK